MKHLKHILFATSLLLLAGGMLNAQTAVTGRVIDAKTQEPVAGVTVTVAGATTGTLTGATGGYSISVDADASLTFRFVGYQSQTVKVAGRATVDVSLLEEAVDLSEVVVVGASLKKSDLTGAVAGVSSKTLKETPVTSINQALQGRVSGVFISQAAKPGDEASIKIRGINSINTGTTPIYVVDGVVMDDFAGSFSSINLNDVSSIDVLKDASATALYGSRASNGVVVITTKKGAAGSNRITYDAWYGIQQFKKTPDRMNTRQLFDLRKEAATNTYSALKAIYDRNPSAGNASYYQASVDDFVRNIVLERNNSSVFAPFEFEAYDADRTYNWNDLVVRDGFQQDHSVSFSGGSESNSYYLSFGYAENQGMVQNLSDKKYTGRINAEQFIKPWLKVGTNTSFTNTQSQTHKNGDYVFWTTFTMDPMYPDTEENKTASQIEEWGGGATDGTHNPLNTLKISNDRTRNRLLSANYLNLNPLEGLNIRTSFSIDYVEEARFSYVPSDIHEAVRDVHSGRVNHARDSRTEWQWDNSITYDKILGDHKISGLLSTSMSQSTRNYTDATASDYGSDAFSYYRIQGSSNAEGKRSISSDFSSSSLIGYLLRANYGYRGKYLLTASVRFDGSSKFAKGNEWGTFPSVSGAWNIMEEDFAKTLLGDQGVLGQLKLRAGFGMVGNQNVPDYSFRTLYNVDLVNGAAAITAADGRRGTPDLTWEKQQQYNVGIDVGLLNNRVMLTADVFFVQNKDLLLKRSLNTSSGFSYAWENIGAMENKGLELAANVAIINSGDFRWNVNATVSADRNKVTRLFSNTSYIYSYDDFRQVNKEGNLFLGEPHSTIYILQSGGIAQVADFTYADGAEYFKGNPVLLSGDVNYWGGSYKVQPGDLYPVDVNGNGSINTDQDRIIIPSDPKFYGGFATDFSWKGIALNAVFTYSYGGKKLSPIYETLVNSAGKSMASPDLIGNTWTPENPGAEYPRPMLSFTDKVNNRTYTYDRFSTSQMDISVQDGSFLRLSALTLSYTFPQALIDKVRMNNLRLYATASNLFCLTPYKGFDPEMGDWYPPTRMFVFGINVSF
ncbi:MAG: TonB-dependent receptor [Prevotellaceae bacterium]|jgi:TonB-linked SusC/RagA family outer membrane protein|nr:TonB-dependent receptor [Prevotellaceae bacterium]